MEKNIVIVKKELQQLRKHQLKVPKRKSEAN